MKRSPLAILLVLLAIATMSAGCSSEPVAPDRAMITWMGKICAADTDLQAQRSAMRGLAFSMIMRSPTRKEIAAFVKGARTDLGADLGKLHRIEKATFDGGDEVVAAYIAAVKGALAKVEKTEKTANDRSLSMWVVSDLPDQVVDALEAAVPKGADLPGLLARNATLNQAFQQVESCKQFAHPLSATASATPTAQAPEGGLVRKNDRVRS